jgi:hypothetical protein
MHVRATCALASTLSHCLFWQKLAGNQSMTKPDQCAMDSSIALMISQADVAPAS